MMRRLREIPYRMLARTAAQPPVLVALIQCATMATEVVQVATESEEDVRFRYSGKNPMRFFGVFLCGFAVFGPPLTLTSICQLEFRLLLYCRRFKPRLLLYPIRTDGF